MPDRPPTTTHVISSAVVAVLPARREAVVETLARMDGTEVAAAEGARIVVLLEGRSSGEVGSRLAEIALLEGVVSANMVFEHVETDEEIPA